jgi:hypothetical protein
MRFGDLVLSAGITRRIQEKIKLENKTGGRGSSAFRSKGKNKDGGAKIRVSLTINLRS